MTCNQMTCNQGLTLQPGGWTRASTIGLRPSFAFSHRLFVTHLFFVPSDFFVLSDLSSDF